METTLDTSFNWLLRGAHYSPAEAILVAGLMREKMFKIRGKYNRHTHGEHPWRLHVNTLLGWCVMLARGKDFKRKSIGDLQISHIPNTKRRSQSPHGRNACVSGGFSILSVVIQQLNNQFQFALFAVQTP